MKLTSSAFNNNGFMPSRYTCDGQNISPPLTVSEVPEDARSLVLIMDDPDIPDFVKEKYGIQIWDHWIVFNIASTIKEISEGQNPAGILGKNTRGSNAYSGPCPPDAEHRYFFKLLALDSKLNLPAGSSKTQIEEAMNGHIIEKAELVGRYN
ncbi:YbhB/YbcL family Raf kinase inhibitor-like protein, partial [Candidatus Woesearchaeota archaeon]|nr:YbhB/YbcL family Raf kinase inhibitor-like protein [Candidatus Woesearchaeota archaeon]